MILILLPHDRDRGVRPNGCGQQVLLQLDPDLLHNPRADKLFFTFHNRLCLFFLRFQLLPRNRQTAAVCVIKKWT